MLFVSAAKGDAGSLSWVISYATIDELMADAAIEPMIINTTQLYAFRPCQESVAGRQTHRGGKPFFAIPWPNAMN